MSSTITAYLAQSADVLTKAAANFAPARMDEAVRLCVEALKAGRPILVCGNGGSASDAMHITGELVGRFKRERQALKVVCLSSNPAVLTAWANDYSYETVFSRQVEAYAEPGGVLLAISTSGNSPNVIEACVAARARGMTAIALTGEGGGKLAEQVNVLLDAPSKSTPLIQQVHICLYHFLCDEIEARMAPGAKSVA